MIRTLAIIQARMTSTRLPGKVIAPLAGAPLLAHVIRRALAAPGVEAAVVAIPEGDAHEPIERLVAPMPDVALVRGPEHDVLARFRLAIDRWQPEVVVRITADCPLIDPAVIGAVVALRQATGAAYACTAPESGYPLGYDVEVVTAEALRLAHRLARDPYEREHVTPFVWRRADLFPCVHLDRRPDRRHWRLCVDAPEDLGVAAAIFERLYPLDPLFGYEPVARLLEAEPWILEHNAHVRQHPLVWSTAS
ncbi:MAG: glycosyltransferase family protein [Gemmatimonadales bacterium]|nr:glycosyltransferase family protein [Gemmatimonadales bacterium]